MGKYERHSSSVIFLKTHTFHKLLLSIFFVVQSVLASAIECVQGMVSELHRAGDLEADMRPVHTVNSDTKFSLLNTR